MDFITPFVNWLLQSEYIRSNKLFINAVKVQDNNIQIVTQQVARNQIVEYVDGSKLYPITFNILNFKSVTYNPLVKSMPEGNENIGDLLEVGKVIEFVKEMEKQGEYPKFGDKYEVQSVYCRYDTPSSPTVNGSLSPTLAKFTIPIVCEVLEVGE